MNLLLQLQSDQLQVPVSRPKVQETTALGAAYLAGLSIGFWNSLDEIQNLWTLDHTSIPTKGITDNDVSHQKWLKAIQRSQGWANDEGSIAL